MRPSTHYRSLDGLRGLAAYTVVFSHFSNATGILGGLFGEGAGQVGVLLFFVLSGFLMGRLYFDQPLSVSTVTTFFRRRVARVVPLYLIVVLASYLWTTWSGQAWPLFEVTRENLLEHVLFWEGVTILWTVPTEIQFYLVFPLLWLCARRFGPATLLLLPLAIAASLALPLAKPVLLSHLEYFLAGLMVALLPDLRPSRSVDVVFVLALLFYFVTMPRVATGLGLNAGGICSPSVYLISLPALIAATTSSRLANRTLGHSLAAFTGAISYSVYLLHKPLLTMLGRTSVAQNWYAYLVVFLAGTTLLGWLSWRWVESPLRRRISGRD